MAGEIVCKCFGLTDTFLKKVIASNKLTTAEQVTHFTKAGGACGGCIPKIKELINEVLGAHPAEERKRPEKLTNLRKMQLIQETLEKRSGRCSGPTAATWSWSISPAPRYRLPSARPAPAVRLGQYRQVRGDEAARAGG